ncbi:uncharacterized protein LOC121048658 [Ixodes scapularis]|uniref:uncharacterized protein LOC121048658 n=1 Tax=Ixodes scapularis TaxID=6945 RepID=UPI00116198D5|nr:uncharacterized protein LOC121048658 [Ixodes scapularis]
MQSKPMTLLALVLSAAAVALSEAGYPDAALYQTNINRQSSAGAAAAGGFAAGLTQGLTGIMNGLVSSLPSMLTNAVPMLLMLGLGGLLLPLLGVSLFFREGQKRTFSLPSINPAILDGLADVLDRVTKAIEQGEKKYATKNN